MSSICPALAAAAVAPFRCSTIGLRLRLPLRRGEINDAKGTMEGELEEDTALSRRSVARRSFSPSVLASRTNPSLDFVVVVSPVIASPPSPPSSSSSSFSAVRGSFESIVSLRGSCLLSCLGLPSAFLGDNGEEGVILNRAMRRLSFSLGGGLIFCDRSDARGLQHLVFVMSSKDLALVCLSGSKGPSSLIERSRVSDPQDLERP